VKRKYLYRFYDKFINGLISRFYPARVRKSLALKILASLAD